ncbi:alpha-amylase family glycosyl hydrolase [Agarivorans sp. QJM3NY_29]|uniref:alpha-amylase family glycosyl hydrolase n=1 Tax=unclassified Agarivorans TaxID=2636026 RepID=UPI003D7E49F5
MSWLKSILSISIIVGLSACGGGSDAGNGNSTTPTNDAINITSSAESAQQRLPCENATGEFCDLRIYQVMTESFVDGDSSFDYGAGYGTSHHNGDLQGIIDSLDYIKALGMNAIWLTPIFESIATNGQDEWTDKLDATGYFASNYFKIDPNFGTKALAEELVTKAHEKGLYVFFDGVFGHHKGNLVTSPKGLSPAGGSNPVDYTNSDTLAFYQEVAEYWTSELCLDGWRLDQAYQVPLSAWQQIHQTVKDASANNAKASKCQINGNQWGTLGYMVAEVWNGNSEIVASAYGSNSSPALPSAFDFNRRYALVQTLAVEESGSGDHDASTLTASWNDHHSYPDHAQANLMLGNHDLVRFGDLIQRGGLSHYWERHKAAFSYMAAYSGPITLYYGDEIGDEVANFAAKVDNSVCAAQGLCDDHVARSSAHIKGVTDGFTPSREQQALMDYVSQLMEVRQNNPALYQGSVQNLYADKDLLAVLKTTKEQQIVYLLNVSSDKKKVRLAADLLDDTRTLIDLITGAEIVIDIDHFEIAVSGLSGRLLLVK